MDNASYAWDFGSLVPYLPLIWRGLGVTLAFTVSTVLVGLVLGLITGVLRNPTMTRWVSVPLQIWTEIFRCTPLLVQLVWAYYALPVLIGVDMSATTACSWRCPSMPAPSTARSSAAASRPWTAASGKPAARSACAAARSSAASSCRRPSR